MIKHVVCWKFKGQAQGRPKKENLQKVKKALESLPAHIEVIRDFEVGINYSPSDAAYDMVLYSSYDMVLYSSFESQEALDAYREHPEHVKVAELIKAVTTERVVVDYEG